MQQIFLPPRRALSALAAAWFCWLAWTGWAALFEERLSRERTAPGWTALPETESGRDSLWARGGPSEAGRRILAREWAAGLMEREPEKRPLVLLEEDLSANARRQDRGPTGYRHCPAPVPGNLSHAEAKASAWMFTGGSPGDVDTGEWVESRCVLSAIPEGRAWEWFYFRRKTVPAAQNEGPLEVVEETL